MVSAAGERIHSETDLPRVKGLLPAFIHIAAGFSRESGLLEPALVEPEHDLRGLGLTEDGEDHGHVHRKHQVFIAENLTLFRSEELQHLVERDACELVHGNLFLHSLDNSRNGIVH